MSDTRREVCGNLVFRIEQEKAFVGGCGVLHLATGVGARVLVKVPKSTEDGIAATAVPAYVQMAQNELGLYETFGQEIGTKLFAVDHPTGRLVIEYHPRGSLDRYLGIDPESTHIKVDFTMAELLTVIEQVIRFDSVMWAGRYTYLDNHAGNYVLCGQPEDDGLLQWTPPLKSTQSGALRAIDFGTCTPIGQSPRLAQGPLMPPEHRPNWVARGDWLDRANPLWDVYQIGLFTHTLLSGGARERFDADEMDAEPVRRLAALASRWMAPEPLDRMPSVDVTAPLWHAALAEAMRSEVNDLRQSWRPADASVAVMKAGEPNPASFSVDSIEYLVDEYEVLPTALPLVPVPGGGQSGGASSTSTTARQETRDPENGSRSVVAEGRTVDDAIVGALQRLGCARDEVTVRVLQEPVIGLFGRPRGEAVVEVTQL